MSSSRPLVSIAATAVTAGVLAGLAPMVPAAASADPAPRSASVGTLVFIKDDNVWLSNGDGSAARQVTTDGTAIKPYVSPSQSDDGIIAAGRVEEIVRMDQAGHVLNRIDPDPLPSSVNGHLVDGNLLDVAISPDGSLIAYAMATFLSPGGASPGYRYATAYTAADRLTPAAQHGTTYYWGPTWVGNGRTLQGGGYGSQVMIDDLGAGDPVHWFDDTDIVGDDIYTLSTDIDQAVLSRDGSYVAAVRGYDEDSAIAWYRVNGDAVHGMPTIPTPVCELPGAFVTSPTWAPDGGALAWSSPEGIWSRSGVEDCAAAAELIVPGGSEPSWSPAPLAPPADPDGTRIENTKRPAIHGTARVGRVLKATAGQWTPASVTLGYRWARNGKTIAGATTGRYRLPRKDRGTRITVTVTATRSGWTKAKATSAPVRVPR